MYADMQTYRHADMHTCRHLDIQAYRHTDTQDSILLDTAHLSSSQDYHVFRQWHKASSSKQSKARDTQLIGHEAQGVLL